METEVKYCKMCRKALPPLSDREYCYACEELLLLIKCGNLYETMM